MCTRIIAAVSLLLIVACQPEGVGASGAGNAPNDAARKINEKTGLYTFEYSYPPEAAQIGELKAILEDDAAASEQEVKEQAREMFDMQREMFEDDLAQAQSEKERQSIREAIQELEKYEFPFRPHYLSKAWDVAADTPGWLSLGGAIETYSGGAHGNQGFESLLWDKANKQRRDATDLFQSKEALRDAIRADFCKALDDERTERRGEPPAKQSDDPFDACIDPLESTILLESSGGEAFDKLSVLVGPYMAGPYVEGSYVIELPVGETLRSAVKPEYRAFF